MIGLDSNVLVRYFAQDDVRQSELAARLVDEQLTAAEPGFVSLVSLAEMAWVMVSVYRAEAPVVARAVEGLLSAPQIRVQDAEAVWLALREFESGNADFADALIARVARGHGCSHAVTFDRRAARLADMRLLD